MTESRKRKWLRDDSSGDPYAGIPHLWDVIDSLEVAIELDNDYLNEQGEAWAYWAQGEYVLAEPRLEQALTKIRTVSSTLETKRLALLDSLPASEADAKIAFDAVREHVAQDQRDFSHAYDWARRELDRSHTRIALRDRYDEVASERRKYLGRMRSKTVYTLGFTAIAIFSANLISPWLILIPVVVGPVVLLVLLAAQDGEYYEKAYPWSHQLEQTYKKKVDGWNVLFSRFSDEQLGVLARKRGRTIEVSLGPGERDVIAALNSRLELAD